MTRSAKFADAALAECRQSFLFDLDGLASLQTTIVAAALALGAKTVRGWSAAEESLARDIEPISRHVSEGFREQIRSGEDPLGGLLPTALGGRAARKGRNLYAPPNR